MVAAEASRIMTAVLSDDFDVDRRLRELGLARQKLLDVAAIAVMERSHATSLHCANAAGTFAYQHATFALREKHLSDGWVIDRTDGVETIRHDKLEIKVAFCNVDKACDTFQLPKARSQKGAGIERAASMNLFGSGLPHYAPRPKSSERLYYLMVGDDGRAELTCPVVRKGQFVAAVERIFLGCPGEYDGLVAEKPPAGDAINNYDPLVVPKAGV